METSKMMEEVWRWKDEIAREIEGMTSQERIAYFRQAEQCLAAKTGGKTLNLRQPVPPQRPHAEAQE
jgi:hypothetical protein